MYAIVETGGKQYKVQPGETIDVEFIEANVGDTVELNKVLLVADEHGTRIGKPLLDDAKVLATVVHHGLARKALTFRYRPKKRYERKVGHRQVYTRLHVSEIKA